MIKEFFENLPQQSSILQCCDDATLPLIAAEGFQNPQVISYKKNLYQLNNNKKYEGLIFLLFQKIREIEQVLDLLAKMKTITSKQGVHLLGLPSKVKHGNKYFHLSKETLSSYYLDWNVLEIKEIEIHQRYGKQAKGILVLAKKP